MGKASALPKKKQELRHCGVAEPRHYWATFKFSRHCGLDPQSHSLHVIKKVAFTLAEGASHGAVSYSNRKVAFTLAEVLITLGIIGVVAAMTLPTLIAKYQEKVLATQIKRAYSDAENALKLYAAINSCTDTTCISDLSTTHEDFTKRLYSVFKGAKYCATNDGTHPLCQNSAVKGNTPVNNGSGLTGYSDSFRRPFFVSSSGSAFQVVQYNECPRQFEVRLIDSNGNFIIGEDGQPETRIVTSYICAIIYFDANGTNKAPNQIGADVFSLSLQSNTGKWIPNAHLQRFLSTGKLIYTPYEIGVPINPR